mgnify:CR=1 FL=1
MSPDEAVDRLFELSGPRASGDEPESVKNRYIYLVWSPRERG